MAFTTFSQWSVTAALNLDLNSIPLGENLTFPSMVNGLFREQMAQLATAFGATAAPSFGASLTLISTDAGATVGPDLILYRNSATPANNDIGGRVLWQFEDSAGNTQNAASWHATITDVTSTSEDATLTAQVVVAGTMTDAATITGTGINSTVVGATTPAAGTFTTLTTTGAFTSLGIDDNATAERLQISNTRIDVGSSTAASEYVIGRTIDTGFLSILSDTATTGSGGGGTGLVAYGGSHASDADDVLLISAGATAFWYDASANTVNFPNGQIDATAIIQTGGFSATGATAGTIMDRALGAHRIRTSHNATSSFQQVGFYNPNGNVGTIATSGSATAYNTSSDYRLKSDVTPLVTFELDADTFAWLPDNLLRLMAMRPVRHKWLANPEGPATHGFIAHELQAVEPGAVTGEKDGEIDVGTAVIPERVIPGAVEPERIIPGEDGEPDEVIPEVRLPDRVIPEQVFTDITEAEAREGSTWSKTGTRMLPQGVDTSFLVASLTAGLQSLTLIVIDQQARIDAMEKRK